jgi:hypothetical protein
MQGAKASDDEKSITKSKEQWPKTNANSKSKHQKSMINDQWTVTNNQCKEQEAKISDQKPIQGAKTKDQWPMIND